MYDHLTLISGRAHPKLSAEIADYLGVTLATVDISDFPDSETHVKLNHNVRGRDVFLIQPTGPSANQNLMELLILVDTCMRASAERITAVIPYFGYARQDRKDKGRVPITAKLVANMLDTAGVDRVLTVDLHAAQIQGFFDLPVDHLYAAPILDNYFKSKNIPVEDMVIMSPDEGSIKRAMQHVENLGGSLAIVDKRRSSATDVRPANVIGGPIEGKCALIFDDMISTAGSIVGAATIARRLGAKKVFVGATHGVFAGPAVARLNEAPIDEIVVTDSLPCPVEGKIDRLKRVSIAPMVGEAIRRIHRNESVSFLFGDASRLD